MPDQPDRIFRVFLCHSSDDKPAVRELYRKFAAEGWIDPWLDEEKILAGQNWTLEIEQAVENADAVIVCLSHNSLTKEGYIQREMRMVLDVALEKPEGTIFVIPLRLESVQLPRPLKSRQYADYFPESERDQAYQRLLVSLRKRASDLGISTTGPAARTFGSPGQKKEAIPPPVFTAQRPTSIMSNRVAFGGLDFVLVPAGPFLMGSREENELADDDEMPQHTVTISYDYWIGRFPVTNEQYAAFVQASGKQHPGTAWERKRTHPVSHIRWKEHAQAYITWLNQSQGFLLPEGLIFRLPTEAEWEKAARGIKGWEWPWGNEFDPNKGNPSKADTKPVGEHSPGSDSPYGCADMTSNVWEWTLSLKKPYPYRPQDGREDVEALGPRVLRGGYLMNENMSARCAYRSIYNDISLFDHVIGFRVAVSVTSSESFVASNA